MEIPLGSSKISMEVCSTALLVSIFVGANEPEVSTYLAKAPKKSNATDVAILYLTDIFGVQLVNNRL
jgi:hypothetical protein